MTEILADVRLALRSLSRRPGFLIVATITLALGIGANTAVYSIVRSVLLEPLPYAKPSELAIIWKGDRARGTTWLSANEIKSYGADVASFASFGAWTTAAMNITGGGEPERVNAALVTSSLFPALGVSPVRGSALRELAPGVTTSDEVILAHGLWQRRFGGAEVVGQTVMINGTPRTIVGVMPEGFVLPVDLSEGRPSEIFLATTMDDPTYRGWGNRSFFGVGRLKPGASAEGATGEMQRVEQGWMMQGFLSNNGPLGRSAQPVNTFVLGDSRKVLTVLAGAVIMILLIACANVANLTLARADERTRDTAVRTALGASQPRLVRQLVTESLVLSAAGGILGAALAIFAVRALVASNPGGIPRIGDVRVDGVVLAITALIAIVTGLAFGLWPAMKASRVNLARVITDGGRSTTAGRSRLRFRDVLTIVQTASAIVLLVGATLLVRSLNRMNQVDLGFRPDSVMTARVVLPNSSYAGSPEVIAFYEQLTSKLAAMPGVSGAGASRVLPLSSTIGNWSIMIEGHVAAPNENPNGDWQVVTPGYFETMGATLTRGRFFNASDRADAPIVAMVSEAMAEKYWPSQDPIGKRFHIGTLNQPWMTIVGIVRPMRHNAVVEGPRTEMYVPHAQWAAAGAGTPRGMSLVVRSNRDTRTMATAVRAAIREMDPNLPVADLRTMRDVTDQALARPRLSAMLLGAFAVIALTLATTGLYGVIALLVAKRRQEIGVRMALGAQTGIILRMVLGQGFRLAGIGTAIGIAGAIGLTSLLQGMLYGVTRLDPLTYVAVPAFFFAVTAAACLIPARRAAALDPLIALRED